MREAVTSLTLQFNRPFGPAGEAGAYGRVQFKGLPSNLDGLGDLSEFMAAPHLLVRLNLGSPSSVSATRAFALEGPLGHRVEPRAVLGQEVLPALGVPELEVVPHTEQHHLMR